MRTGTWGKKGQSIVELAFLMPFLLYLCMGVVDFGRIYYFDNIAIDAARSGARVAANHSMTDTQAQAAATTDAGGKLQIVSVTVSPVTAAGSYRDPGSNVTVTVTYNFTPITPLIGRIVGSPRTVSRTAQMMVVY